MKFTERSTVRRLPKRGSHEAKVIYKILDAGFLAQVGFCLNGQPFVIPTLYGRKDDRLYIHGSAASRMLRELETGLPACVTVTHVDGLVLARSAFHHSINYRSVVAFGTARLIEGTDAKVEALRVISEHIIAGRWSNVRQPNEKELKITSVLEFSMEEASAKIRTGPPADDEEDYELPIWAGVIPIALNTGEVIPDPRLVAGLGLPEHVVSFRKRHQCSSDSE